jgi:hypothetical protein
MEVVIPNNIKNNTLNFILSYFNNILTFLLSAGISGLFPI